MTNRFKNVHPLMVYMPFDQRAIAKAYAKRIKVPVSQLVREGLLMRMVAAEDRYNAGWNDALLAAMEIATSSNAGRMMYPSGRSFAQILNEEVEELKRDLGQENK